MTLGEVSLTMPGRATTAPYLPMDRQEVESPTQWWDTVTIKELSPFSARNSSKEWRTKKPQPVKMKSTRFEFLCSPPPSFKNSFYNSLQPFCFFLIKKSWSQLRPLHEWHYEKWKLASAFQNSISSHKYLVYSACKCPSSLPNRAVAITCLYVQVIACSKTENIICFIMSCMHNSMLILSLCPYSHASKFTWRHACIRLWCRMIRKQHEKLNSSRYQN